MAVKDRVVDRVPPCNIEAEMSALGCMLLSREAMDLAAEKLNPESFYEPAHRTIFSVMLNLYEAGEVVDPVTVANRLDNLGKLDAVGGAVYLTKLDDSVPTTAHADSYFRIVSGKAVLRNLIQTATEIVKKCYEAEEEADELLDMAETSIFDIAEKRVAMSFTEARTTLTGVVDKIEKLSEKKHYVTGVPSGFPDLDELTSGFQNSELVVLASRPSMGKTALALSIAEHIAVDLDESEKIPVAIFSLETSADQLVQRMLCSRARIDSQRVRKGYIKKTEWPDIIEAAGELTQAPIFINDMPALSVLQLRAIARRLKSTYGIKLVIVDYLQLLRSSGKRYENRQQEISDMSRSLKALARELDIPVLVMSQLNRDVENRPNKRPQLSDLRECVTGETPVLLSDGRRLPIRDLVGMTPKVITLNNDETLGEAVSDKVWRVGPKPVYIVHLASGRRIKLTKNHRLYGASGWVPVSQLKQADRVALARFLPEPKDPKRWPDLRVALLGQLIGDGSYLKGQPMRYTTSSEENSRLVEGAVVGEFGGTVKRYAGRSNWHQLLISGNGNRWHPAGVNRWLRELGIFGQRSHQKRIPQSAFQLDNEQVALLLRHLWATDGTIYTRKPTSHGGHLIHFSTNSGGLAEDVAVLLLRFGIVARIQTVQKKNYRPTLMVVITGVEAQQRFLTKVGDFGPRKQQAEQLKRALRDVEPNPNVDTLPQEYFQEVKKAMATAGVSQREMAAMRGTSYGGSAHFRFAPSRKVLRQYGELLDDEALLKKSQSDLFWDRVAGIEYAGEEDVYDLTVPGTQSWLADGIISHNSGAIEQDADVVLLLVRQDYYNPDERPGIAELIVAKQRNGPVGKLELVFLKECTRFEPLSHEGAAGADEAKEFSEYEEELP